METLSVGMYVRTKNGMKIGKITQIHKAVNHKSWYELKNGLRVYSYEKINEPSYNITDLISRFDLVNGYLVICKMYEDEKDIPTIIKCVGDYYFKEEDIKSVITHEQIEQMAYKVEE